MAIQLWSLEILEQFHFTFLIRHPRHSIPSYHRCTNSSLDAVTRFYDFTPNEAELHRVFDYLRSKGFIGPALAREYEGPLKDGEVRRQRPPRQPKQHHRSILQISRHLIHSCDTKLVPRERISSRLKTRLRSGTVSIMMLLVARR